MANVLIEQLTKRFGELTAVDKIDLDLVSGELVSFLGPSGCGKTTLLRMIAGLQMPTSGSIHLGDRNLTSVPTHNRNIGMVFQSLALFPHLTVAQNIAYGLRIRNVDKAERNKRVNELLELVQLEGTANRSIKHLSGGQRQRVAMARSLALRPDLFLLDEPMSALDANLRESMQIEIRQLQQRLGITTIVVTHDQAEAMTMSDKVVVMNEGRIEQVGTPLDIYRKPVNRFVADFIGNCNLLDGTLSANDEADVNGITIQGSRVAEHLGLDDNVAVAIRPEDVVVLKGHHEGQNRLTGTVEFVRDVGATVEIMVQCGDKRLNSMMLPKDRPGVSEGMLATIEFPVHATSLI